MSKKITLTVYTLTHFAVDLGCGWLIYALYNAHIFESDTAAAVFLLYNFLAFGTQFIIGAVVDILRVRNKLCHRETAYVGSVLVLLALILGAHTPWLSVTLVGLGNSAFHVGGGIDSLIYSDGKMARCGIFVSSGAVGVALGMLCGARFAHMLYIPASLVALCAFLVLFLGKCNDMAVSSADGNGFKMPLCGGTIGLGLCLLAVLVRSYSGFLFSMPWKQGFTLVLVAAGAAMAGKAIGGILSDRLGAREVGAISLALSVPLVIFGRESIVLSVLGIICFNIAMPITLHTAAARLRGYEGFAFGLTTLALLVGYLMFNYISLSETASFVVVAVTGILAVGAVYLSSPGKRGRGQ